MNIAVCGLIVFLVGNSELNSLHRCQDLPCELSCAAVYGPSHAESALHCLLSPLSLVANTKIHECVKCDLLSLFLAVSYTNLQLTHFYQDF